MLQKSVMTCPETTTRHSADIVAIANWNSQNKLWSTLAEVGEFLHSSAPGALLHDPAQFQHLHVKAGQRIHALGQTFDSLYLVNSGFIKTVLFDEASNELVLNFPMKGDVLGMDSIHTTQYTSEAIALSECDIILLPFKTLVGLSRHYEQLEQAILILMSKELARQQQRLSMHGTSSAEARVAKFLLSLSERFCALGYSRSTFNLRMTRNDIGSYLGLTLETVSRTLSAMNELGIISVCQRHITINDAATLQSLRKLPSNKLKSKLAECFQGTHLSGWAKVSTLSPALS